MSAPLCFPHKVLDQHLVVLGKTGAGKSSALRHVVEHLLSHNKRVCVIDPKGDWWGLRSSADGKSQGFPVVLFGDFKEPKGDVPINAQSGKHVAEIVTGGNRPCVIGFRGWMTSHMTRFWIDFASTIFNANSGELYLVVDEFHNFAPKGKIMDPEAGKCLHWSNRLLSEGRGLGVVCLTASQRPQKVHNDSLTSHETLVAMRVIHAADRQAIKDWIDGCGDAEQGKEVLNSLASLARGEAWVWSPEIGFGPKRVKFPMFETFDSFAPPQLQRKVTDSGWADVDLGAVKEKLAMVIEEAKANDPRELRAELARLKAHLAVVEKDARRIAMEKTPEVPRWVDRPIVTTSDMHELAKIASNFDGAQRGFTAMLGQIMERLMAFQTPAPNHFAGRGGKATTQVVVPNRTDKGQAPRESVSPRPVARAARPTSAPAGICELGSGGKRRILIALAQYDGGMNSRRLSLLTGISASGGTWRTYLGELRSAGYVAGGGDHMQITDIGAAALGPYEPLPTGHALREYWRRRLGDSGKRRIFDVVVDAYPRALTYEEVSRATEIDTAGGTWRTYLGELRGLELIEGRGELKACDDLFE